MEAEPKAVPLGEFGDDWPSEEMIERVASSMELYYSKVDDEASASEDA